MAQTIFNETSRVTYFKVWIDDVELPQDDIEFFEWKYDLWDAKIEGLLQFKDSFNLSNSNNLEFTGKTSVKVSICDYCGNKKILLFKVVDFKVDETNPKVKRIAFSMQDTFSFDFEKIFSNFSTLEKIKSCIASIIINSKIEKDVSPFTALISSNEKWTIISNQNDKFQWIFNKNDNAYNYFKYNLMRNNLHAWRDNTGFKIGTYTPKNILKIQKEVRTYTNQQINTDGYYYIHEHVFSMASQKNTSLIFPKQEIVSYNGKEQKNIKVDLTNIINDLVLNDNFNFEDLQPNVKNKIDTKELTENELKYITTRMYLQANKLDIYVVGDLVKLNIGEVVNIKLASKSVYTEQQLNGDVTASGKYIVGSIINKIIGDCYIQKVRLTRFDNPKPIKS